MIKLQSHLQMGAKIGAGHFGEVFSAVDSVHGEVAVKVLTQRPGETSTEWQGRKDALLQEGKHLSQATHQNVVQVYHLLESDTSDAIHLVMKYCKGGSLQKAFEKGPIPLADVLKISTDVCLGLEALHARGMLHRDIKPGNLLRDAAARALLGDFGLVTDDIILGYGSQAGYADHIAPEVWAGSGTSIRTDIWALGMTIYRLLHGATWYGKISDPQLAVQAGGFAKGLPWLPHIPKKWRTFIRKMLCDDPSERYQTANQVMTALAGLPRVPAVSCTVKGGIVEWKHVSKKRKTTVRWTKNSARSYEWEAWSEPVAVGNRRKLGASNGVVNRATSEKQLQNFFAIQLRTS